MDEYKWVRDGAGLGFSRIEVSFSGCEECWVYCFKIIMRLGCLFVCNQRFYFDWGALIVRRRSCQARIQLDINSL